MLTTGDVEGAKKIWLDKCDSNRRTFGLAGSLHVNHREGRSGEKDLAPRDGHISEHGFGECGPVLILPAVNRAWHLGEGFRIGRRCDLNAVARRRLVMSNWFLTVTS